MSGDYEVGYGKPPVHTQFKKGQSANPGGKPGAKKTRRQRFAQMLDEMLLQSTEKAAMTPCKTCFAETARGMVLDTVRGKTAAIRQVFALLDELDPKQPGQRRPRGIDQMLEEAEWADEDASWCGSERDTDFRGEGISEGIIEEPVQTWAEFARQGPQGAAQRWSEIAQERPRRGGQTDGLKDRAVEDAMWCGSEPDSDSRSAGNSQRIIKQPLQRWSEIAREAAHGEDQIDRPDEQECKTEKTE